MIHVGAASKIINNEIGRSIQAAGANNKAEYIRDDSEAGAMYFAHGDERFVLVSCDIAGLMHPHVASARAEAARTTGLDERSIIIAGTHQHSGPSFFPTRWDKPVDEEYLARLVGWIGEIAREAVASSRPAEIGWGLGTAQLGYNRRLCWADGTHVMHGDTTREDFTGMEGPDDPSHLAIFARDTEGKLIAVLYNNTTHPTSFYARNFYSADFAGEARTIIRSCVGDVPVLFFNGAQGDIANSDQTSPNKNRETGEDRVRRMGALAAGETLRLLHEAAFHDDVPIRHVYEDLQTAVRMPTPEHQDRARKTLERVLADDVEGIGMMERFQSWGTVRLVKEYGDNPVDALPVHAIRIGDVGIATQPCELFCQFGLDIKRRSPAPVTAVFGITDGYGGYVPTTYGLLGGGYGGTPTAWCRQEPAAGYKIVDCACKLLYQLWK